MRRLTAIALQLVLLVASSHAWQARPDDGRATEAVKEVVTIPGFSVHGLQLELPHQPDALRLQLEGWHHDECPLRTLP